MWPSAKILQLIVSLEMEWWKSEDNKLSNAQNKRSVEKQNIVWQNEMDHEPDFHMWKS